MQKIHESFRFGKNFSVGHFAVIEEDVVVGDDVTLGHFVTLKKGTRIGNDSSFGDYACTTGPCRIGNGVRVSRKALIAEGLTVLDGVFIGGAVMTSHTKHVTHGRRAPKNLPGIFDKGCVIGNGVNILAGVSIAKNTVIGGGSNVVKTIEEPGGVWVGNPAKRIGDTPGDLLI